MADVSKEEKLAADITNAVNCFGFDSKKFAKAMLSQHKTLQQNFMRAFAEYLKELAETNYVDDRNLASQEFAKAIIENVPEDKICFPYI